MHPPLPNENMAPVPSNLIGPPGTQASPGNHPLQNNSETPTGDPFLDLMLASFNTARIIPKPPPPSPPPPPVKGYTENYSPTFLSTGNPCLDFFFHVVPDTPPEHLTCRLAQAWSHDPLTSLKLLCHLRGVRNTGKCDKEGFYAAALWLHKHHPKTLAANAKHIVDFGYFKDLPEILYRLLEGLEVRKTAKMTRVKRHRFVVTARYSKKKGKRFYIKQSLSTKPQPRRKRTSRSAEFGKVVTEAVKQKIQNQKMKMLSAKAKARVLRKEKKVNMAKRAVEKYTSDPDYRFLHDSVSEVFAERLVADLKFLRSGEVGKISMAAKWCPSLDSSFDRATLLCESIARRVFTKKLYPEYEAIEDAHYAYRTRDRLRKELLVPLRRALQLPELYMSSNRWNKLPYGRVASVAMTNYKKHFKRHDKKRFEAYLEKVERGEAKIAAGALLPHEVIKELEAGDGGKVAELQWRRMVQDLLENRKLRDCIAVCDVSGSMAGTPMDVCVALGLLISELSEGPWKGQVITFSRNPQLHIIQGNNLREKIKFVKEMEWGANTDFQKVFDRILQVAVNGKLSKEQMIKKVFVFSDMEFDCASGAGYIYGYGCGSSSNIASKWDTDYEVIQKKFENCGYDVPGIVFWNLRDSKSTPVESDKKGVALVSGFSKNIVKLFLDEDEMVMEGTTPENTMKLAISGPEYSQLVVLD